MSESKAAEQHSSELPATLRWQVSSPDLLRCLLACLAGWQLHPAAWESIITRSTVRTHSTARAHLACGGGHTKEGGVWQLRVEAAQHGHPRPGQHTVLVDSLRDVKTGMLLTAVLS